MDHVLYNIKLVLLKMHNYRNQLFMAFSEFLVFSRFTVSQYHYIHTIFDLLHFDFIPSLYHLVVINKILVLFYIFILSGFPVTN